MQLRWLPALLLIVWIVGGASATVLIGQLFAGQTFYATAANITLNVSGLNFSADRLEVTNDFISLQNISYNTTGATFSFSLLNFTTTNSYIYSWQFPNVSSSSGNTITILNGLSQSISSVTIMLGSNGLAVMTPWVLYPNGTAEAFDMNGAAGTLQVTINSLPVGVSVLHVSSVCDLAGNAACQVPGGGGGSGSSGSNQSTVNGSSTANVSSNVTQLIVVDLTAEPAAVQGRRNTMIVVLCAAFVFVVLLVLVGLRR